MRDKIAKIGQNKPQYAKILHSHEKRTPLQVSRFLNKQYQSTRGKIVVSLNDGRGKLIYFGDPSYLNHNTQ